MGMQKLLWFCKNCRLGFFCVKSLEGPFFHHFCDNCFSVWRPKVRKAVSVVIFTLFLFFFCLPFRLMQSSVESVWNMAFDFILDNVQVVLQQTYGSTLKVIWTCSEELESLELSASCAISACEVFAKCMIVMPWVFIISNFFLNNKVFCTFLFRKCQICQYCM